MKKLMTYVVVLIAVVLWIVLTVNLTARNASSGNFSGGIVVGDGGSIRSGASDYTTGTGWFMDYNGGTPRLRIGNPSGNKLTWDGSTLTIAGTVTAGAGAIGGWSIGSTTLTGGDVTLDSDGSITAGDVTLDGSGLRITPTTVIANGQRYGFSSTSAGLGYNTTGPFLELSGDAIQAAVSGGGVFYLTSAGITASAGVRKLGAAGYPWEINGATGVTANGACTGGTPYMTYTVTNGIVESIGCTTAPGPSPQQQQIDELRAELAELRAEVEALRAAVVAAGHPRPVGQPSQF
jgi:hypothetical protein